MVMSPNGNLEGQYFLFTINHRSVPDYEPGGCRCSCGTAKTAVDAESCAAGAAATNVNDTIAMGAATESGDGVAVV